ncbi:MAG: TonB family protein [Candidatus Sulfotelmatobacter sp.]
MKSRRQSAAERRIPPATVHTPQAKSAPGDSASFGARPPAPTRRSPSPHRFNLGAREGEPADQVMRADVALDLVLEQIVSQTRLSTCATGAFIGWVRGGQMVSRVLNGATSGELVAYLRRDPRMVDACLRTSALQYCRNSENFPGLDAVVCRSLGARSIVLVPVLKDAKEKIGVLGAFSSQADAFTAGDLVAIQSMSQRVADTIARVDELACDSPAHAPVPVQEISRKPSQVLVESIKAKAVALASGARRSLLAALVVGTLLLAGWALSRSVPHDGLHLFARNSRAVVRELSAPAPMPAAAPNPPTVQPVKPEAIVTAPAEPLPAKPSPRKSSLPKSSNPPSVRAKHHVPDLEIENTLDGDSGVIVFEDTGVQGASTTSHDSGASSASLSSSPGMVPERTALARVVDRVEPEYPEAAKAHHIQGIVVLDVLVGGDGRVQRLSPVRGYPRLVAAAADAVRQWRFEPMNRNGRPASFETNITLTFALP